MPTTRFYADLPNESTIPVAEVYEPLFVQAIRKAILDREQELRKTEYVAEAVGAVIESAREKLGFRTEVTVSLSTRQFAALADHEEFHSINTHSGWFRSCRVIKDTDRPD